jgi:hypothetical protein
LFWSNTGGKLLDDTPAGYTLCGAGGVWRPVEVAGEENERSPREASVMSVKRGVLGMEDVRATLFEPTESDEEALEETPDFAEPLDAPADVMCARDYDDDEEDEDDDLDFFYDDDDDDDDFDDDFDDEDLEDDDLDDEDDDFD